jgi:hypothetical protein
MSLKQGVMSGWRWLERRYVTYSKSRLKRALFMPLVVKLVVNPGSFLENYHRVNAAGSFQ